MTYSECAQLSGAALSPDSQDLGYLSCHAQNTCGAHGQAEVGLVDLVLVEQEVPSASQSGNPRRDRRLPAAVVQNQRRNSNVLDQNKGGFAVGAERESMADVVAQRDEVCAGLQDIGEEREAFSGLRVQQLEELRDLDDRGCADDTDSKTFRDGELDTLGLGEIDVVKERLVADRAKEVFAHIHDGFGKALCNGRQYRANRRAESVHGCGD